MPAGNDSGQVVLPQLVWTEWTSYADLTRLSPANLYTITGLMRQKALVMRPICSHLCRNMASGGFWSAHVEQDGPDISLLHPILQDREGSAYQAKLGCACFCVCWSVGVCNTKQQSCAQLRSLDVLKAAEDTCGCDTIPHVVEAHLHQILSTNMHTPEQ